MRTFIECIHCMHLRVLATVPSSMPTDTGSLGLRPTPFRTTSSALARARSVQQMNSTAQHRGCAHPAVRELQLGSPMHGYAIITHGGVWSQLRSAFGGRRGRCVTPQPSRPDALLRKR